MTRWGNCVTDEVTVQWSGVVLQAALPARVRVDTVPPGHKAEFQDTERANADFLQVAFLLAFFTRGSERLGKVS